MFQPRLFGKPGYFWFMLAAVLAMGVAVLAVSVAIIRPNQLANCLKSTLNSRNQASIEALQSSVDSESAFVAWISSFKEQVDGPPAQSTPEKQAALARFNGDVDRYVTAQKDTIKKQITQLKRQQSRTFAQCR